VILFAFRKYFEGSQIFVDVLKANYGVLEDRFNYQIFIRTFKGILGFFEIVE